MHLTNKFLETINYSGIFFSYFSQHNTKCIHAIPVHSLNYIFSGEQVIEDGNKTIVVKAGEAVFVRRNHKTRIHKNGKTDETYKGISLTFERNVLREFYNKIDKKYIPDEIDLNDDLNVLKIAPRADIKSLFQSLSIYFDESIKPTDAITNLKVLEGIYALLNTSDVFYKVLFDFVEPWKIDIIDFLNENYMDDLSMDQIASYTGRSLATFKRDFKRISSLSPQKWIIKKRLEEAYHKLKVEGMKVQDVYVDVGFKNSSHFSTAFKKQYGFSPTEVS